VAPPVRQGSPVQGLHAFAFDCADRAVLVAWADVELAGEGWLLTVPDGAETFDIVGRRVAGGSAKLSSSPVYVVRRAQPAKQLADSCRFTEAAK
jgi:hypothetical protein